MIFPDHSIHFSAKSNHNISEDTVIHIQTTFPDNLSWINAKFISLLDVIIK